MTYTNTGAGKGSKPRPMNKKKFDENYNRIFHRVCGNCKHFDKACTRFTEVTATEETAACFAFSKKQ